MMDIFNTYLTVAQAVSYLRIGRSTLYSLVSDGKLRVRKIGRRSVIARSDLDALLAPRADAEGGR